MKTSLRTERRIGFSLVELLVVVSIMAVLLGILLPAVQMAQEAFNKAACQSNLHQWGVAMHNYHEVFGTFPAGCTEHTQDWASGTVSNVISPHLQILPYFEESNLHALADFNEMYGGTLPPHIVKIFQCPGDLMEFEDTRTQITSYQVNCGTWVQVNGWDGMFGPNTEATIFGAASYMPGGMLAPVKIDEVSDGSGCTALMSEVCSARSTNGDSKSNPRGYTYRWQGTRPRSTSLAEARADMLAKPWQTASLANSPHGMPWTKGDPESTWYNHVLPPNSPSWMFGAFLNGDLHRQVNSATSWHPTGVNVLMCDASVHTITSKIDADIWSALGSRNGGENADLP